MTILPLAAFNDNYIWTILQPESAQAWVVDPGDAQVVENYLQANKLKLVGILITHHHKDHTGGVKALVKKWQCDVFGPAHLAPLISQPVKEGSQVSVFEHTFTVLATPAHTLDHLCYFSHSDKQNSPILFSGDTLFRGGCGRLMEGSATQMLTALNRLMLLPENTYVYCTHEYTLANYRFALSLEPDNQILQSEIVHCQSLRQAQTATLPSNIALEKQTNPFLRSHHLALVERAAAQLNELPAKETNAAFAQVRRAKDSFS